MAATIRVEFDPCTYELLVGRAIDNMRPIPWEIVMIVRDRLNVTPERIEAYNKKHAPKEKVDGPSEV